MLNEKYILCTDKLNLITEMYESTEGEPEVIRQAKAVAYILDNIPIWIEDDELLVGNVASKPGGIEIDPFLGLIVEEDIKKLVEEGVIEVEDKDWPTIRNAALWWGKKNRQYGVLQNYDDRLWNYMQLGITLPPLKSRVEGRGTYCGTGMGLYSGLHLAVPDYEKVLSHGLDFIIEEAKEELKKISFFSIIDIKRKLFLEAVIIALSGVIRFANRFAVLSEVMAKNETDPFRKKQLERIANTCSRVPQKPARNFYEAFQAFWFIYLVCNPSPTIGMGRFDQYMYPFFKKDKEKGINPDSEVLALLGELRIKDMKLIRIALQALKRTQHSGHAKWHNMVIGGLTVDGRDATNELTYLILEAAKTVKTPHHTITLRIHEDTPSELMIKALEVVKTGIGMPAFVSDKSYMNFLESHGVPVEIARDYAIGGCLDVAIPGLLWIRQIGFFVAPKVLEIFMNGGIDPRTGLNVGPFMVKPENLNSFAEYLDTFKEYLAYFIKLWAETNNFDALRAVIGTINKHVVESALMTNGIKNYEGFLEQEMPYGIAGSILLVGMINVVDSLAAVKKIVFEDKKASMNELLEALAANWHGYEDLQKMFKSAPKYGNDDDFADLIASDMYGFVTETIMKCDSVWGGKFQPGGVSISSMWTGGMVTGATPDGRYADEVLADGSLSPMRGKDIMGPIAVLKSAVKINQEPFTATLLNMKFHLSSLRSTEDLNKLSSLIKTYFSIGGKHIQFNVADKSSLVEAQKYPDRYKNLLVRVAGYSAYFTELNKPVQDEVLARTGYEI